MARRGQHGAWRTEGEVREAKRGKLGKVRALHGGRVARNGDADTDNWEDAPVLIAASRNWVDLKPTTHPLLAER